MHTQLPSETPISETQISCIGLSDANRSGGGYYKFKIKY